MSPEIIGIGKEKNVFISYLEGLSFLFFDDSIKNILETGAVHSTLLYAFLAEKLKININE